MGHCMESKEEIGHNDGKFYLQKAEKAKAFSACCMKDYISYT